MQGITRAQLKVIFDTLCDGVEGAALPMTFMQQFNDAIPMYFWMRKNKLQGQKIVDLFEEKGHIGAVQYIRDRMYGRNFTSEKLNAGDLL